MSESHYDISQPNFDEYTYYYVIWTLMLLFNAIYPKRDQQLLIEGIYKKKSYLRVLQINEITGIFFQRQRACTW